MIHIAVGHIAHPFDVVDIFHTLDIHGKAFEAVRDFNGDRFDIKAANLLEVGELRHFHPVEPDLPAHAPGTQGRRFPIVFNKTDIVFFGMDP